MKKISVCSLIKHLQRVSGMGTMRRVLAGHADRYRLIEERWTSTELSKWMMQGVHRTVEASLTAGRHLGPIFGVVPWTACHYVGTTAATKRLMLTNTSCKITLFMRQIWGCQRWLSTGDARSLNEWRLTLPSIAGPSSSWVKRWKKSNCFPCSDKPKRRKFIHSFAILSDDKSKASSKTIPPHSAI